MSVYATLTVIHINMAQPKPVAEATLDMIEIMTRAFDESEGGEGVIGWVKAVDLPPHKKHRYRSEKTPPYFVVARRLFDPGTCPWVYFDDFFEPEAWCGITETNPL